PVTLPTRQHVLECIDKLRQLRRSCEIDLQRLGANAELLKLQDRAARFCLAFTVGENDISALGSERHGDVATDIATASRDQRDFAAQGFVHNASTPGMLGDD